MRGAGRRQMEDDIPSQGSEQWFHSSSRPVAALTLPCVVERARKAERRWWPLRNSLVHVPAPRRRVKSALQKAQLDSKHWLLLRLLTLVLEILRRAVGGRHRRLLLLS